MGGQASPLELMLAGKTNLIPKQARLEFAFLLGTFSRNHGVPHRQLLKYDKTFASRRTIARVQRIAQVLGAREPKMRGPNNIHIYDQHLTSVLHSALEAQFHSHIASDAERIEFLRGFFASSQAKVATVGGTVCYYLTFQERPVRNYVLSALFEVGIYPRIPRGNIALQNVFNLRRFQELKIDHDEENKTVVRRFLEQYLDKVPVHPSAYYALRKKVEGMVKQGQELSWLRLSREFGVTASALSHWMSDIVPDSKDVLRKPLSVDCYEQILQELKLPNIYLIAEPAQRHEKIFIPSGTHLYQLPPKQQEKYLFIYDLKSPLDADCLAHLQGELRSFLGDWTQHKRRRYRSDLSFKIEDGVIQDLDFRRGASGARRWYETTPKVQDDGDDGDETEDKE